MSEDGSHRPAAERHARGREDPEGFYRDSDEDEALVASLLAPFAPDGDGRYVAAAHDVETDRRLPHRWRQAADDEVLVVDGIFLQRPGLDGRFDLVVFIDVPFAETFRRMAVRDGWPADPDHPANRRHRAGQQLYLDERDPAGRADVVTTWPWAPGPSAPRLGRTHGRAGAAEPT